MRKCKVCGVSYKYFRPTTRTIDESRWEDVACSKDHADIYFEKIRLSRLPGREKSLEQSESLTSKDKIFVKKDGSFKKEDSLNTEKPIKKKIKTIS